MSEANQLECSYLDLIEEWTTSEKKLLERLVRVKYDFVFDSDVSPKIKENFWRKLTNEFNKSEIRADKRPRSTMELRLQWEKMTEIEFSVASSGLLSRMYNETRARNLSLYQFYLLDSSAYEEPPVKRRMTAARSEEANANDQNSGLNTVKTEPAESKDAEANKVDRIVAQLCEIDKKFWTNKIERINAQCETSGNKN